MHRAGAGSEGFAGFGGFGGASRGQAFENGVKWIPSDSRHCLKSTFSLSSSSRGRDARVSLKLRNQRESIQMKAQRYAAKMPMIPKAQCDEVFTGWKDLNFMVTLTR